MANSQAIDDLYKEVLGRERNKTDEQGSEEENADKYGMDSIRRNLEERKGNAPQGQESATVAWNNEGGGGGGNSMFPDWYRGMMESQVAQQNADRQQAKERSDALYSTLNTRANQSLQVGADDPIIKGQVDAFRAEQNRAGRNYLSDVAESSGPYANLRGEQRMAAEKIGQGTSGFQAELLARELGARRDEVSQALGQEGSMLSGDQARNLQALQASLGQAIGEANVGLGSRNLDLGFADLALRDKLGTGSLGLQQQGLNQGNDQFLRELGLRQWDLGDQSDYRWASLGR
jgi:hypothetical protein